MKFHLVILLILIMSCTTLTPKKSPAPGPRLTVTEINPNKWTGLTRQNLDHLVKIFPLAPMFFTTDIHIQPQSVPTSHPILTLNTRYAENPNLLLASFLHYELHWWLERKSKEFQLAQADLKSLFFPLPAVAISKSEKDTFQHLIICFLEYEALIHYLNLKEANKILKDLIYKEKIHPWIYKQAYKNYEEIKFIVKKYELMPTF